MAGWSPSSRKRSAASRIAATCAKPTGIGPPNTRTKGQCRSAAGSMCSFAFCRLAASSESETIGFVDASKRLMARSGRSACLRVSARRVGWNSANGKRLFVDAYWHFVKVDQANMWIGVCRPQLSITKEGFYEYVGRIGRINLYPTRKGKEIWGVPLIHTSLVVPPFFYKKASREIPPYPPCRPKNDDLNVPVRIPPTVRPR